MPFKPILALGVTCPYCLKDDMVHPTGSNYGKKRFKCFRCKKIFIDPTQRIRPPRGLKMPEEERKEARKLCQHMYYLNHKGLGRKRISEYKTKKTVPKIEENPVIKERKPITIESVKDCPCFACSNYATCDPRTCELLDSMLRLYEFPLCVCEVLIK
jgi:hypothetical protein